MARIQKGVLQIFLAFLVLSCQLSDVIGIEIVSSIVPNTTTSTLKLLTTTPASSYPAPMVTTASGDNTAPASTFVSPPHTHSPPKITTATTTIRQEVCENKISTCSQYGHAPCTEKVYEAWAKHNCARYCGLCSSSISGLNPYECQNKVPNCQEYDDGTLCKAESYYAWVYENCKGYCKMDRCSVDGAWSDWAAWEACDVTCGNGTQHRHRQCDNPPPSPVGGLPCKDNSQETQNCTRPLCPVHGNWGSWSEWGICSVSCGQGLRRRDRYCNNPYPDRQGDHCFGTPIDYAFCYKTCIDDSWSIWSDWNNCKDTCGSMKFRERMCLNRGPIESATNCVGSYIETERCNCSVRLRGGNNRYSGRLEVFHNGIWGTVCDDGFSDHAAQVACRMLGYPFAGAHFKSGGALSSSPPPGQIWLEYVNCNGTEVTLENCNHNVWGVHNCQQLENVYVFCYPGFKTYCGHSEDTVTNCSKTPSSFTVTRPVAGNASDNLAFSSIVSMVGKGYNSTTGIFTCPVSGTYIFTVTLVKKIEYPKYFARCFLRLNGADMVLIHINPQKDSSSGISVTLHISGGDEVDVGSCSRADLFDSTASVFSGILVN